MRKSIWHVASRCQKCLGRWASHVLDIKPQKPAADPTNQNKASKNLRRIMSSCVLQLLLERFHKQLSHSF